MSQPKTYASVLANGGRKITVTMRTPRGVQRAPTGDSPTRSTPPKRPLSPVTAAGSSDVDARTEEPPPKLLKNAPPLVMVAKKPVGRSEVDPEVAIHEYRRLLKTGAVGLHRLDDRTWAAELLDKDQESRVVSSTRTVRT